MANYEKIIKSGDIIEHWQYSQPLLQNLPLQPSLQRLKEQRKVLLETDEWYRYWKNKEAEYINQQKRKDLPLKRVHKFNSRKRLFSFKRLVQQSLSEKGSPLFVTLTTARIEPLKRAWRMYSKFIMRLRYKHPDISYICVVEFQKRGAPHFHMFLWGMPHYIGCTFSQKKHSCGKNIYCERKTRYLYSFWKEGWLDVIKTDGSFKLVTYLSKYLKKGFDDERFYNCKRYVSSRNISKPFVTKTNTQVAIIKEEFKINDSVDKLLVYTNEYMTEYLGKCVYKVYNINKEHDYIHIER